MFQSHIYLYRLAVALNVERDNITRVSMSCQQIGEFDLAVEWVHVISILVDLMIPDRSHDVAHLKSGLHRRCARFHIRNVHAAAFAFFLGELTQFWIARGKE